MKKWNFPVSLVLMHHTVDLMFFFFLSAVELFMISLRAHHTHPALPPPPSLHCNTTPIQHRALFTLPCILLLLRTQQTMNQAIQSPVSKARNTRWLDATLYLRQQNKWYPKGVYLLISKLRSILAVVNLLAHNNL